MNEIKKEREKENRERGRNCTCESDGSLTTDEVFVPTLEKGVSLEIICALGLLCALVAECRSDRQSTTVSACIVCIHS